MIRFEGGGFQYSIYESVQVLIYHRQSDGYPIEHGSKEQQERMLLDEFLNRIHNGDRNQMERDREFLHRALSVSNHKDDHRLESYLKEMDNRYMHMVRKRNQGHQDHILRTHDYRSYHSTDRLMAEQLAFQTKSIDPFSGSDALSSPPIKSKPEKEKISKEDEDIYYLLT